MGQPVDITTSSIPNDFCFTTWPAFWTFGVSLLSAELQGDTNTFNAGDTTPAPNNRDKPWLPPSAASANPPAFVYNFDNGYWLLPHPIPAGIVVMYEGSEASIETFDGGEAGAITETTGPMWQKVSALNAKIPIGPGTLPSTRVITQGGTLGSEKVELLEANIPLHELQGYALNDGANLSESRLIADDDRNANALPNPIDSFGGDADGATVAHENMPPVYGIFFIKKTARKFYRR